MGKRESPLRQRCSSRSISGRKNLLLFSSLSFFLDISSYGYIHRDIYVIASSTRAISSDGKNNVFRSSSGLYLTFLPGYMTLFLLIMRAAQHVSSFIYHFQYHFPSALLACCSTIPHSLYFAIFLPFFLYVHRPTRSSFYHLHQRPSRLSFTTGTDEPAIRIRNSDAD